ncbi:Fe(3+)-hydroxamate ABC transporter permease FhuB [Aureimonas flava]|uniref:Fe(3+)-hydroxamate ABC transporter permease FhuB n=1 Tax=Aureimonas flava TaxID=2320271 RepID=A0A3A1WLJ0_9HYPH|nr:Fe(3+)-hydroxamate ABC transporter permease FhuB [Aureimonas flava]RIY01060.1 Fe(3+)-hydroxamate ABC transporter permease FhuB [Aureimonas flava]
MRQGLVAALGFLALALLFTGWVWSQDLPPAQWWTALRDADAPSYAQAAFALSAVPRLLVALLAGAALGLSGFVLQEVLRNPLAEPATLGLSAGAQLGVTTALLLLPGLGAGGRMGAALLGAGIVGGLVLGPNFRRGLDPVRVVLTGLVVNLMASGLATLLALMQFEYLRALFVWGSGSLLQNDGSVARRLAMVVLPVAALLCLLARPLALAGLGDASMRSLGVRLAPFRMASLGLAVVLAGVVTADVGVIGFIGLAAPHLARLSGAGRSSDRVWLAPLFGAALLAGSDALVQGAAPVLGMVPTGTLTAMLGAPLILLLLPRLASTAMPRPPAPAPTGRPPGPLVLPTILALPVVAILIAGLGPAGDMPFDLALALEWRWPRMLAAAATGALLALAGALIQRLLGNDMASPEVLGVSSGAAAGVTLAFLVLPVFAPASLLGFALAGAVAAFVALLSVGGRRGFSSERLLLAGVALGTLVSGAVSLVIASGHPRAAYVLAWMAGPTYRADMTTSLAAAAVLLATLPLALSMARPLTLLPLGPATARALGLALGRTRLAVLSLAAVATSAAVLVVGPSSFVGLIAPHLARTLGFTRAANHLLVSATIGATTLMLADGLGRSLMFPYEIPAGVLASLLGGPYFVWALSRTR